MDARQTQYVPTLVPGKNLPSDVRLSPYAGKTRQPFRFLDLPAEIRRYIYDLWIPDTLHVSLGCRGIRLQYFAETREGFCFQVISPRPFFLSRQIYDEFCHALFARSTWSFSCANLLSKAFCRLHKFTTDRIRHVSIRLTADSSTVTRRPTRKSKKGSNFPAFEPAQLLRQMKQLQTLLIYINLTDFGCLVSTRNSERENRATNICAASYVANFTWDGLQTRVPFAESDLTPDFIRTLKAHCGDGNVSSVPKHKDRYAGQMVDIVISPCTVVDQTGGDGGRRMFQPSLPGR